MHGPVGTIMADHLQVGKPSRYYIGQLNLLPHMEQQNEYQLVG